MSLPPITGAPDVRRHNLSALLHLLHLGGPMRRADLTGLTGLNRSTIAGLVGELAELGAVAQEPGQPGSSVLGSNGPGSSTPGSSGPGSSGPGSSTPGSSTPGLSGPGSSGPGKAGRPSPVVRTCPETVQVLAADVAVGHISMALVGLGGSVVARAARPVRDSSPEAMAELLVAIGQELMGRPEAGHKVVGLGVSVPGVVRERDGNVRFAPNLGWEDAPYRELVAAALADQGLGSLPVRVGNDGDLGALAEHLRGVARGVDDLVFVEGEVGVGCGVIIGGQALAGAGGYAGELGHMTVRRGGRRCRCGARGCWETEIGTEAMVRALGLPNGSSEDDVVALLRVGGPKRAVQLDEVARFLGTGLANVVNLLNPRLIVLGGLLRDLYPLVSVRVGEAMVGAALAAPMEQVTLALPELGGDAVLLGAAEFAWQDTLADPAAVLG